jgi:glycosyltransferase involved in cell wall biosynthesis
MKIVHICQSYPPMVSGQSYMVERLAMGAINLGHEAMVICASDQPKPYEKTIGKLHLVRLASLPNPFRVGQRFTPWGGGAMRSAMASFAPDVVQLHDPTNSGLAGLSAARALGVPILFTTHAGPWVLRAYLPRRLRFLSPLFENLGWIYGRWFMRKCDLIVAPSSNIAQLIKTKTGIKPRLISNGADLGRFYRRPPSSRESARLRRHFGLPREVPVILHVGRLDSDKNIPAVIRAAATAMRGNDAHLLVVGDGVERARLVNLCKKLGIAKRSHFPGYVDFGGDLPGVYRLGSVFVTASEMEVQSLVMLEAIASGLPMVAVDATSTSELIRHGKSGYLVKPGDEEKMAIYISDLLAHPAKAKSFGRQARKLAEQHTLQRTFKAYEKTYRELASR